MPLLKVYYASELKKELLNSLSTLLSKSIADVLGKSEDFVMIIFQKTELQSFGNDSVGSNLYLEMKNVGVLPPDKTTLLTSQITNLCQELTGIEPTRIYIEFQEYERHHWGWNGKTFSN
ncbi:MAG: phenylpyruvate tautomerase MIF-related protein [Opitutales bacterium]|nr:phenylpyruvate tautomerase MIF-related protein [Opitutales bacterium]MDG1325297.1 phenylpyruvate tautomerase MIF-related protein [Opitutales bacterium]